MSYYQQLPSLEAAKGMAQSYLAEGQAYLRAQRSVLTKVCYAAVALTLVCLWFSLSGTASNSPGHASHLAKFPNATHAHKGSRFGSFWPWRMWSSYADELDYLEEEEAAAEQDAGGYYDDVEGRWVSYADEDRLAGPADKLPGDSERLPGDELPGSASELEKAEERAEERAEKRAEAEEEKREFEAEERAWERAEEQQLRDERREEEREEERKEELREEREEERREELKEERLEEQREEKREHEIEEAMGARLEELESEDKKKESEDKKKDELSAHLDPADKAAGADITFDAVKDELVDRRRRSRALLRQPGSLEGLRASK